MSLRRYTVMRFIQLLVTFFIVMTLIFILFRLMPGDPGVFLISPKMSEAAKETIREQFGLTKSIPEQYIFFIKNTLKGEFGNSFYYGRPVKDILFEKILNSMVLFTFGAILAYAIGMTIGKIIAWKRGSKTDTFFTMVGLGFWTFFPPWLGLILIWIFSYRLDLFPLGGMITPDVWAFNPTLSQKIIDFLHHLALPLMAYVLMWFAGSMLIMRNSMLETLREDYILTAKAKGLKDKVVRDKHAARNAMLPVVTSFSMSIAFSFGGGVLIETVFSWPGIGRTIVDATLLQDYPLAQASFMVITLAVLIANFAADIVYAYLDPRVKY
ncbi:MAG: ABC transporter permease [Methanomicrobia archaeon]|nr:ABC transporter permease [Methanomicrobia archaeon]